MGLPITGGEICFLGGGYELLAKEEIGMVSNLYNSYFSTLEYIGVSYKSCKKIDSKPFDFIKAQIDSGNILCMNVSTKYLEYSLIFQQSAAESPHFINVIGYNEAEEKIKISDGFIPTLKPSLYEGWANCSSVLTAWKNRDFEHILFDRKEQMIDWDKCRAIEILNLKKSIFYYLYPQKESQNNDSYGEMAIKKSLYGLLADLDDRKEKILDLNYKLRINGFFSIKRFTLQALEAMEVNSDLCKLYNDIISEWNNMSLPLIKASISNNLQFLNDVVHKGFEIIEKERKVLCELLTSIAE